MKKIFILILVATSLAGCSKSVVVHNSDNKKVPPGQMKKITGSQSAKQYAPGQQKKASTSSGSNAGKTNNGSSAKTNSGNGNAGKKKQ
jgi:hypothetical protein